MVERIDAQGQYFRDVSRKLGLESRDEYRLILFGADRNGSSNTANLQKTLSRLSQFPDFHNKSFLVYNTKDTLGVTRQILAVPNECPGLLEEDLAAAGKMPKSDETYIAFVRLNPQVNPYEILILSETLERTENIVRSRMKGLNPNLVDITSIEIHKISPEKFIEEAKRQIDRGIRQPPFVLRFAGLSVYQQETFRAMGG